MTTTVRKICFAATCGILLFFAAGCYSPGGMAVQFVGKAVDSADTKQLADELVGRPLSAADSKLGQPVDTWRELQGLRAWRTYSVSIDPLGNQRYVVQFSDKKIVALTKVKIDGTGVEVVRKLGYDQKVVGKSPQECESILGHGPPLVTMHSEKTGQLMQVYDAKMVHGVGSPQYCSLRFDPTQRCIEAAITDVSASTKDDPAR